jgi:prevent-host-death family protein
VAQIQFVTATWARRHVYEILDRVTAGATIVVTRYGKPVARIVPHDQLAFRPPALEASQCEERNKADP